MDNLVPDIKEQLGGHDSIDDLTTEEVLNRTFVVEIIDNATKGLGFTKITGKATFIPYVNKGDIVELKITKNRKKYMLAKPVNIIKPCSERIVPECKIYKLCGGCWYQHITYEHELKVKRESVINTLKTIGHLTPEVLEVIPSKNRKRYRNHIQVKSSIKRDLGFFMPEKVMVAPFPEEGCLLIPEEMNNFVREFNRDKNKIIPHNTYRIRQNYENEVFTNGIEGIDTPKYFYEKVGKYLYRVGFHNFFQVNRYQIENWLNAILDYVGKGYDRIVDIYCGVGLITFPLSERAEDVIGIESNRSAIKDAKYSMEMNNINNVKFIDKKAKIGMKEIESANVIVIDPPRSGCQREVIKDIIKINPQKIVSVSCDAATFSRDCRYFVDAGYELKQVQPVDMFPFTHHIEMIGLLVKNYS